MSDRCETAFRLYMNSQHPHWHSWDEWQVQSAREDFRAGWDAHSTSP